ncbi:MAG: hypothetical protein MUC42_05455, partial [Bryobacter sp.]|nr:hypothetical protein [Bryobacter sp.]
MSVQVFLQGQLVGSEDFLLAPPALGDRAEAVLYGRAQYVSLLGEVLPRALLRELGLAPLLLGASGGDQFLIVLPEESRAAAEAFLASANQKIAALTGGTLEW